MADDLVVPGEFIDDNLGLALPDLPSPELRTRLNPEGKASKGGADFGISFRGSQRQNTVAGAASEAGDIYAAKAGEGSGLVEDERTRLERAMQSESKVEADAARKALERKERMGTLAPSRQQGADDALIEQIAYENAGSFKSAGGTIGSILGAVASPENIGGFEGLLARKFPLLLGTRPVLKTAADAAITNTLTDPVVQGIRTTSGGQENYDVNQTLLAPVVGFGAGAALRGTGAAIERGVGALGKKAPAAAADVIQPPAEPPARTIDEVVNGPDQPEVPAAAPAPKEPINTSATAASLAASGEPPDIKSAVAVTQEVVDPIKDIPTAGQRAAVPQFDPAATPAPKADGAPAGVFMFDPTQLNVDAERLQFKSGGDEYGVTGALRSVSKWDPAKAQAVIVWEANDGKLYVADGHQRAGLARRLVEEGKANDVQLPGILFREQDGITAEDIRSIAAVTNIANGSGSAIDGAKVLRSRPDLLDGSLPLSVGKGKQAAMLAKLDDEAFRMVVNEVVPENYGAVVGEIIPNDGARQVAALKAIARFQPRNAEEAAILTQRVSQAELAKAAEGSQTSMFGDLETPESTAGEEMRIVGRAIADLKKDKALFSRVLENAERIEQTGSNIERASAAGVATDAEVFARSLASDAYTAGPVRDELVALAKQVKDGRATLNEASARILDALRRQAEAQRAGRDGNSGIAERAGGERGAGSEAAAAGEQTLIPGVQPVTDRERIALAAERPLKGGNEPSTDGLFNPEAGTQPDLLFRKRSLQQPGQPLPNQVEKGRPVADQGTAVAPEGKVTRLEDLSRKLVEAFQTMAREGGVKPGALGQYSTRFGVVRVKNISDFDTLVHEVGHSLHMGSAEKLSDFDPIVTANQRELQALGAGQGSAGDAEAFANLFHAYVANRPFAERNYPNAVRALDEVMRTKYPKELAVVDEVRAALDLLHRAPSEAVVSADQISKPPPRFGEGFREAVQRDIDPQGRTVFSVMDALYTATVDSLHPVLKATQSLVDTARANGTKLDLKPIDDPYILARMMPGSHGAADTMLKHGVIPAGGIRPEGPSLASGIEKALGKKFDQQAFNDFGAYLTSRRMVTEYQRFFNGELERPPGKFSFADYKNAVTAFEAAHPSFAEAADDVYAFQRNYLTRVFNKGMVTKEFFEAAGARADYVPLMRDMADFAGEVSKGGTGGAGSNLAYSVAKKFKGSDRSVINPLESIFKRVHDLEFAIATNDTVSALADIAEHAGPGAGYIYEPIPSNQMRAQHVDLIEALKAAGKSEGIDGADLTQLILQVEDQFGDSTWATLFRQEPIKEGREPIIFHWKNGERRAGRLGDQRLGQELHHALTALSDYEKNWFVATLQVGQMMLRTGVTRSIDFMMVNFIRDQFTSALTAGRKYTPFVSAARGVVDALMETPVAIEYAGQGGIAGGAVVSSIEHSGFGKNVYSLTKGNLLEKIGKAFDLSEAGTRVGLYKSYFEQAKEIGWNDENSAMWATFRANDYIDFRKHGSSLGILRRTIPFLNAAVQGTDKEFRSAIDLPRLELKRARGDELTSQELDRLKDARVAYVRLVGMGIVLGAGLAVANQDNERWQNAPAFTRNQNFLFTIGGMDFAMPKGFGIVQTVVNLFERATEGAIRKDPSLAGDWLEAAGSAFMPPTQNPFLSTYMDVSANYNRFREKEIVPYYMQGWEKPEQYNAYTSMLARQIAKAANMAGVDMSPMKIDYTLQQLGGGMARDFLFGWDAAMGNDKPEKQIYDYPVLRRFVKNLERGSKASQAFYQLVGEKTGRLEQVENAYRGKINNGERASADEYLRNLKDDERAWVALNTFGFSTSEKRLQPLYNARERVSVINGMVRQLVNGNVVKDSDLDRTNLTLSRRDAKPIQMDPKQRSDMIEELLSLSVATTRNAMVAVGAKGTTGLGIMPTKEISERLYSYSPDAAEEFDARLKKKNLPDFDQTVAAWPEMKRRLLVDGENADLSNLVPTEVKLKAKRRGR